MKSKDLSQAEVQRELDLFRQPEPNDVPLEIVRKKPTAGAAFTLACDSSGLDDQSIYSFVGIDAGTFSRIKKGLATLQADLVAKFCYAVNNRIYPEWCAFQLGCTLVEIKTEAERRAEAAEKRAAEAELKVRVLMETFQVRATA
ncbi:transcriptional regulator [Variovorax ginsengisoli]|uniref:Transcriptional regulator n=1 Tax=Variovorax ginsengisoli TaxID=363844 RepID=A0ABT8SF89_9BURK|nr:transcriptional regulator [Variovorax ginsengisoli]MDN8617834.1 transcriptional regulator [Variovorax ginsengisoli]MDO1537004.1 transcriptional regulator [Variovorax ginsengisoli]